MDSLIEQLKKRRLALGFKQHDMQMRVGMSRQQYQRLESKGNPRLETLELLAKGLNSEIMLIPREKLAAIQALLDGKNSISTPADTNPLPKPDENALANNPWKGLLGGEDE